LKLSNEFISWDDLRKRDIKKTISDLKRKKELHDEKMKELLSTFDPKKKGDKVLRLWVLPEYGKRLLCS